MNLWNTIVILCSAALLFLLCRREWLRSNRARLSWRIIASSIAVVCLACMALGITITHSGNGFSNEAVVVTDGADPDTVALFRKQRSQKTSLVDKEVLLSGERNDYDTVHLFGYGFTSEELLKLKDQPLVFHPSAIRTGMSSVHWNRSAKKGETINIQGTYINRTSKPVTLLLEAFNAVADSVNVPARGSYPVRLHTIPKQNGRALYSLISLQGKDTLAKDPLPVEVGDPNPVRVMILSSSPDFENRFLKDWLSQNGYVVVATTTISANKVDRSAYNVSEAVPARITPSLLDSFDVLVSDEQALSALAGTEREALFRQVNNNGMGLIMRGDSISRREWYNRNFHLFQVAGKQPVQLSLSFRRETNAKLILPVDQPQFIRLQNGMQALVNDSAGNAVAAVVTAGAGKILYTTLNNSYNWQLAGNTRDYHAFWNLLLQKSARQTKTLSVLETAPAMPVTNQPVTLRFETKSENIPVIGSGADLPAFAQDPFDPYRWETTWWPSQPGWQAPLTLDNQRYNWYVYNAFDWRFISADEKTRVTGEYLAQQKNNTEKAIFTRVDGQKPVSLFWFFLPFIICCGFLWWENKIS